MTMTPTEIEARVREVVSYDQARQFPETIAMVSAILADLVPKMIAEAALPKGPIFGITPEDRQWVAAPPVVAASDIGQRVARKFLMITSSHRLYLADRGSDGVVVGVLTIPEQLEKYRLWLAAHVNREVAGLVAERDGWAASAQTADDALEAADKRADEWKAVAEAWRRHETITDEERARDLNCSFPARTLVAAFLLHDAALAREQAANERSGR